MIYISLDEKLSKIKLNDRHQGCQHPHRCLDGCFTKIIQFEVQFFLMLPIIHRLAQQYVDVRHTISIHWWFQHAQQAVRPERLRISHLLLLLQVLDLPLQQTVSQQEVHIGHEL